MKYVIWIAVVLLLALGVRGALDRSSTKPNGDSQANEQDSREPEAPEPVVVLAEPEPGRRAVRDLEGEARRARIRSIRKRNEEGVALLEKGQIREALAIFEACVRDDPEEPVFVLNLAEALTQLALEEHELRGDLAQAIPLLERAVGLAPERKELALLLAEWKRFLDSEAELWEYESPNFELVFDAERPEFLSGAQDILDVLEGTYTELESITGSNPVGEGRARVRVVVYDGEAFGDLMRLGKWAGGIFDGTVRLPIAELSRDRRVWTRVLRHELVHVFIRSLGGRGVPSWLNEGIAQCLEGDIGAQLERSKELLKAGGPLPLERISGSIVRWKDEQEILRAYAQSLLLVDWIATRYGQDLPWTLVRACKAGSSPDVSFRTQTGVELSTVLNDVLNSL